IIPMGLSWLYFQNCRMKLPPLGVMNLKDVVITLVCIIVIPFIYLVLPTGLVAVLFSLLGLSLLQATLEGLVGKGGRAFGGSLVLTGLNVGLCILAGSDSPWFWTINNLTLILCIVGIANLWVQSGL